MPLADLRTTLKSGLATKVKEDDASVNRPSRLLVRELLGVTTAKSIAMAEDPLPVVLETVERRLGADVIEALVNQIHVPPTAEDLDGSLAKRLESMIKRLSVAREGP